MKPPIVSIIITTYNQELLVKKCIESVVCQNYKALQIIIIDDGSTDHTVQIIKYFAEEDIRIEPIYILNNCGVVKARNMGIERATGRYITFIDGDDYLGETYIEALVSKAEETNADMVFCGYTIEGVNDRIPVIPSNYVKDLHEEWVYRICSTWSRLYKKEIWDRYRIKFIDEDGARGEDTPICLLLNLLCESIESVNNAEYFYVQHNQSAMHTFKGMRKYNFPYKALDWSLQNAYQNYDNLTDMHLQFYSLGVTRLLGIFCFILFSGADKDKIKEFSNYATKLFREGKLCQNQSLINVFSKLEIPFVHKTAVVVFIFLVKNNLLFGYMLLQSYLVRLTELWKNKGR